MIQPIEDYLFELIQHAKSVTPLSSNETLRIAEDLSSYIMKDLEKSYYGICSSLLFNSQNSLLNYLSIASQHKDLSKSKELILSFISDYIKLAGQKHILEHAVAIKDTCFSIFRKDRTSKIQQLSFDPIIKLIQFKSKILSAEVLDINTMTKIYLEEFAVGKLSQSVKSGILQILGLFSEHFPGCMTEKSAYIIQIICDDLTAQFKSKKPDFQLIAGGMNSLTYFLVNFSYIIKEDTKRLQQVFRFIEFVLNPPSGLKVFNVQKSGLRMINKHGLIFKTYITERYESLYKSIKGFCLHPTNKSIRKYAFGALETFLECITKECTTTNRSQSANVETLVFFLKEFWVGLESTNTSILEASIYIRGLGRLSNVAKQYLKPNELKQILLKLMVFSERMYVNGADNTLIDGEETIEHLPNFINALANIFFEVEEIDEYCINHVERIIGTFFLVYPQLYEYQRWENYRSLTRLFISLYTKGTMLQKLLSRIIFQGLIVTCSKPTQNFNPDSLTSIDYYFEYQDLWKNLLSPKAPSDLEYITKEDIKKIKSMIYDEFISSILKMIKKLDLQHIIIKKSEIKKEEQKEGQINWGDGDEDEDDVEVLRAQVPKDFELFLNLVEFCRLILGSKHIKLFENWIYLFTKEMIIKSNQYPLVSGFYKLLSIAMNISDKLGYFNDIGESGNLKGDIGEVDFDKSSEKDVSSVFKIRQMCYLLASKFIKELIVRLRQYKDELLGSCLNLVLSMPHQFVHVKTYVPCLQIAFKIGLRYFPICETGLNAIEYWHIHKRSELLENLSAILPHLNDYLFISQSSNALTINYSENDQAAEYKPEYDSQLKKNIQTRIIKILSILGGHNNAIIKDIDLTGMMAWDNIPRIDLKLKFDSHSYNILFDDILPRITDLAENSSDRQIKVASCEFLHSIVLYMIAKNAFGKEEYNFTKIYQKIFPVIIKLATDVEQIAQQLFEPLLMQLIHWFTGNTQAENPETIALLDAVIESVSNEHNGSLRIFSAKCLTEFLKWSIKQSSISKQKKNPFNAKSLFKRLYNLAHHPGAYHRLGCYLTFKHLYRVFREEESLVDQFALEITCNLFHSLRLSVKDDESLGTTALCQQVIESMGKIINHYASVLYKPNEKRRMIKNLSNFVSWTFKESRRLEPIVRRVAFTMFLQLVNKLPGNPSASDWVKSKIKENDISEVIIKMFESQTSKNPPTNQNYVPPIKDLEKWFESLSMTLDVYYWILYNEMIHPDDLINGGSMIFGYIEQFLTSYAKLNIDGSSFNNLLRSEKEKFNKSRCFVITRIFKFIVLLIDKYQYANKIPLIKRKAIYSVCLVCILTPDKVGINTNDVEQLKKFRALTAHFINSIKNNSPPECVLILNEALQKLFVFKEINILTLELRPSYMNVENARQLINGYIQLHNCKIFENNFTVPKESYDSLSKYLKITPLAEHLLIVVFEHNQYYSPVEINVIALLLQFILSLLQNGENLVKILHDDSSEQRITGSEKSSFPSLGLTFDSDKETNTNIIPDRKNNTKGEMFYYNFKDQIESFIIQHYEYWIPILISQMRLNPFFFRIIMNLLDRISIKTQTPIHIKENVVKKLMAHIPELMDWIDIECEDEQKDRQIEFTRKILKVDPTFPSKNVGLDFLYHLFSTYLVSPIPLHFKIEVLDILPYLLSNPQYIRKDVIRKHIEDIIINDFPVSSKYIPKESTLYSEYIACLEKLLHALCTSKCVLLLDILAPIFKESDHLHIEKIDNYISKFISSIKDNTLATEVFNSSYNMFMDNKLHDSLRLNMIRKVCLPVLERMSIEGVKDLFCRNINTIVDVIKSFSEDKNDASSKSLDSRILTLRIGMLHLVHALYQILPLSIIKRDITLKYMNKDKVVGNEITQIVMRSIYSIRNKSASKYDSEVSSSHILDYHRTAYTTLASIVMSTQSKEKFFTIFCFKEELSKGELIWDNIIDLDGIPIFEVETYFPTATKELKSLYSHATRQYLDQKQYLPKRYISSNYLSDSSLSQDVSEKSPFFIEGTSTFSAESERMEIEEKNDKPQQTNVDVIELDSINSSPCMFTILDLIDCMMNKFQSEYDEMLKQSPPEMPLWMSEMHKKISSSFTHINIKIFIAKIVINRSHVFAPYAQYWFEPLADLLISHDEIVGMNGLNYFVRDLCIIFLKWDKYTPTDNNKHIANKFIELIMKKTYHSDRQIVNTNLKIVRLLIERWKSSIYPSKKIIHEYLIYDKTPRATRMNRLVGLHLFSFLLMNGFEYYSKDKDKDIAQLVWNDAIMTQLLFSSKEVYSAAAETISLAMSLSNPDSKKLIEQMATEKLTSIFAKDDHVRFLNCLQKMSIHSPDFLDNFILRVIMNMKKKVDMISVSLDLILMRIDKVESCFEKLKSNIEFLIKHRDSESQYRILQILLKLIPSLNDSNILFFLSWICSSFRDHPSEEVREVYYDVLIAVYNHSKDIAQSKELIISLLYGLVDSKAEISSKLFDFWHNVGILKNEPDQRIIQLMSELYHPEIEKEWLRITSHLLLRMCSKDPDYEKSMFSSLTNCKFKEIKIDSTYNYSSGLMTPLFGSQSQYDMSVEGIIYSQNITDAMDIDEFSVSEEPQIRATQAPQFTETQSVGGFAPLDTQNIIGPSNSNIQASHDELREPSNNTIKSSQISLSQYESFESFSGTSTLNSNQNITILRRFVHHPSIRRESSYYWKQQYLKKKRRQEALIRDQNRRRQHQVTIFRQYRKGDLPDVASLSIKGILEPLLAVSWRDETTSRQLVSAIQKSFSSKNTDNSIIKDSLMKILNQTSCSSSHFINWVLQTMLIYKDIIIPASIISPIVLRSTNYHVGIVCLENQILELSNDNKKYMKAGIDVDEEIDSSWRELAKLYKIIGEDDDVIGIYESHIAKLKITHKALSFEVSGSYDSALKIYDRATEKADQSLKKEDWKGIPPSEKEIDMWETARLECFVKLTRWDDLAKNTIAQVQDISKITTEEYREPYLRYYIESHLQCKERWPDLWKFVANTDDKSLEEEFSKELAFMYIVKNDVGRSSYYIQKSREKFLETWSSLPNIAKAAKLSILQNLQRTYEIDEYIQFINDDNNFTNEKGIKQLISNWRSRFPSVIHDNINVWEWISTQRVSLISNYYKRFNEYLKSRKGEIEKIDLDPNALNSLIRGETINIYRKIASCARKQNNLYVADKYLRLCLGINKHNFDFPFFKSLVNLHCLRAKQSKSISDVSSKYVKALKFVLQKEPDFNDRQFPEIFYKYNLLIADIYSSLFTSSIEDPKAVYESISTSTVFIEDLNKDNIVSCLMKQTLKFYGVSLNNTDLESLYDTEKAKSIGKAHFKFSDFCFLTLKHIESNDNNENMISHLQSKVISSCFESMRLGNRSAQSRFPRLLQIISNSSNEVRKIFSESIESIETWMLFEWTNQMMARLDRPEASCIIPILTKIAKEYPQSIYFQYKISSESLSKKALASTKKIKHYLKHDLLEKFTESLSYLTHPEHRAKDWMDMIKPLLNDESKKDELLKTYNMMVEDCLNPNAKHLGSYNKSFAQKFRPQFDSAFGNEGIKLLEKDEQSILRAFATLDMQMKKDISSSTRSSLTDFSMWLAEFDSSNYEEYIEIPGQYNGFCKPQVDLHVKISSFDSGLLVMSSIRKPKRLKIRGNNEREYMFLVKGGEDLRLDQRVQQLFSVMNRLMEQNSSCSKRKLRINTYDVIPMTTRVGIIEWVVDTQPLKSIIEGEMKRHLKKGQGEEQAIILRNDAYKVHSEWLSKYRGRSNNTAQIFLRMIEEAPRSEVENMIKNQHKKVKWDLLRGGVLSHSASQESFISIRKRFTTSLASFSIGSYIIGIGDRHLDNFLLNLKNGEVIGIDFGHAFGTATQILPIPELVPFRMTRQFVNFLKPHGVNGLLKHTMIHTLEVLRENKEILLDTMDVFVNEPLLDWENQAKKLIQEQEGEGSNAWIPKQKILIASRKLSGDNPSDITVSEIHGSALHSNKSYTKKIEEYVLASNYSIRGASKRTKLSAEEQVECLIDQATDLNLLGRSWVGWASWV